MKSCFLTLVAALTLPSIGSPLWADDLLVADFESGTYEGWTVTGDAFGAEPARGTLPQQLDEQLGNLPGADRAVAQLHVGPPYSQPATCSGG